MTKSKNNSKAVTDEQVELYNTINPLINSIFKELKDFSKKNQNDPINLTKVKMINRLLVKAQIILKNEPSINYLDLLEENQNIGDLKKYLMQLNNLQININKPNNFLLNNKSSPILYYINYTTNLLNFKGKYDKIT